MVGGGGVLRRLNPNLDPNPNPPHPPNPSLYPAPAPSPNAHPNQALHAAKADLYIGAIPGKGAWDGLIDEVRMAPMPCVGLVCMAPMP